MIRCPFTIGSIGIWRGILLIRDELSGRSDSTTVSKLFTLSIEVAPWKWIDTGFDGSFDLNIFVPSRRADGIGFTPSWEGFDIILWTPFLGDISKRKGGFDDSDLNSLSHAGVPPGGVYTTLRATSSAAVLSLTGSITTVAWLAAPSITAPPLAASSPRIGTARGVCLWLQTCTFFVVLVAEARLVGVNDFNRAGEILVGEHFTGWQ